MINGNFKKIKNNVQYAKKNVPKKDTYTHLRMCFHEVIQWFILGYGIMDSSDFSLCFSPYSTISIFKQKKATIFYMYL